MAAGSRAMGGDVERLFDASGEDILWSGCECGGLVDVAMGKVLAAQILMQKRPVVANGTGALYHGFLDNKKCLM